MPAVFPGGGFRGPTQAPYAQPIVSDQRVLKRRNWVFHFHDEPTWANCPLPAVTFVSSCSVVNPQGAAPTAVGIVVGSSDEGQAVGGGGRGGGSGSWRGESTERESAGVRGRFQQTRTGATIFSQAEGGRERSSGDDDQRSFKKCTRASICEDDGGTSRGEDVK